MRPKEKVQIKWSPTLAYAIGLIASDGNLSPNGRHINFTSKDEALAKTFKEALCLNNKIGKKARGGEVEKKYFVVQFGDVVFYRFLMSIGLTPNKSKTLAKVDIPDKFFIDFLRGCIDGDGSITIHKHPQSKNDQLRLRLSSASQKFLEWAKRKVNSLYRIKGGWIDKGPSVHQLCYGKADSVKILNLLYYPKVEYYLERKFVKAKPYLKGEWWNW